MLDAPFGARPPDLLLRAIASRPGRRRRPAAALLGDEPCRVGRERLDRYAPKPPDAHGDDFAGLDQAVDAGPAQRELLGGVLDRQQDARSWSFVCLRHRSSSLQLLGVETRMSTVPRGARGRGA